MPRLLRAVFLQRRYSVIPEPGRTVQSGCLRGEANRQLEHDSETPEQDSQQRSFELHQPHARELFAVRQARSFFLEGDEAELSPGFPDPGYRMWRRAALFL